MFSRPIRFALFYLPFCSCFSLSSSVQASDYVSCVSKKLQGFTDDAAVKTITEACRVQYQIDAEPASGLIASRYLDNSDGTVTDIKTKLTWQRCSVGQTWIGNTCTGLAFRVVWGDAMRIAPDGWRLPTIEELTSLVVCSSGRRDSRCLGDFVSPTINQLAFPSNSGSFFWSSSLFDNYSDEAWCVFFNIGHVTKGNKKYRGQVRLVRVEQ